MFVLGQPVEHLPTLSPTLPRKLCKIYKIMKEKCGLMNIHFQDNLLELNAWFVPGTELSILFLFFHLIL